MGSKSLAIYSACFPGIHDDEGNPLSGGKMYFYDAGTTTPKDVYNDRDKTSIASQPVILDTYGRAEIYGDGLYKIVITNSADATVYDLDNMEFIAREGGSLDDTTIGLTTPAAAVFTDVEAETLNVTEELTFMDEEIHDKHVLHNQTIDSGVSVGGWVMRSDNSTPSDETDDEWVAASGNTACQGLYWKNTSGDKMVLISGLANGFTGLVESSTYYLADDGTLSTDETQSSKRIKVGVAVSSTQMIVNIDIAGGGADTVSMKDIDALLNLCEIKKQAQYNTGVSSDAVVQEGIAISFDTVNPLILTVGGSGYSPPAGTITLTNADSYSFHYPLKGTIYNAGSAGPGEDITLVSDNGSGVYTLEEALDGSYTASSSYVKLYAGTVVNQKGTFLSGATAGSYPSKNAHFHEEIMMQDPVNNGKLIAAGVFEPAYIFNVSAFSSATQTVLLNSTGIDLHSIFGGKFVLFKVYINGNRIENPYSEALATNFKVLTASTATGSGDITLVHEACAVFGTDEAAEQQNGISVWYAVPLNLLLRYYCVDQTDSPTYTEITISLMKCMKAMQYILSDTFEYTNALTTTANQVLEIGGGWRVTSNSLNSAAYAGMSSGDVVLANVAANIGPATSLYRTVDFNISKGLATEINYIDKTTMDTFHNAWFWGVIFGAVAYLYDDNASTHTDGIYANIHCTTLGSSATVALKVGDSTGELNSASLAITAATDYYRRIKITRTHIYLKMWKVSDTEPTGWTVTGTRSTGLTFSGTYLKVGSCSVSGAGTWSILKVKSVIYSAGVNQILIAGQVTGQDCEKLGLDPHLIRYDTTYDISNVIKAAACFAA